MILKGGGVGRGWSQVRWTCRSSLDSEQEQVLGVSGVGGHGCLVDVCVWLGDWVWVVWVGELVFMWVCPIVSGCVVA